MEVYSTNMGLSMFLANVVEDDVSAEPYREPALKWLYGLCFSKGA